MARHIWANEANLDSGKQALIIVDDLKTFMTLPP